MRIHIVSDFHIEFAGMDYTHAQPECDLVIIAGDVAPGPVAPIKWISRNFSAPVIFVPGNHEFYRYPFTIQDMIGGIREEIKLTDSPQITLLNNQTHIVDNVRIIGATLWTDYNLYKNPLGDMVVGARSMNDFRHMCYGRTGTFATAQDLLKEHKTSLFYIKKELSTQFAGATIVVTHHCPSHKSIHPQYGNDPLNASFASNLDKVMTTYHPDFWIHGHTHSSFDYNIGKTRVICNPHGYKQAKHHRVENTSFRKDLVIDV